MTEKQLTDDIQMEQTRSHFHLWFQNPREVLSSAVLNGGFEQADHLLNLRVPKSAPGTPPPQVSLQDYCNEHDWRGTCIGMMTAASMDTLRLDQKRVQHVDIIVWATSGLANARRIGDQAEYRRIGEPVDEAGTINLGLLTSARLAPAAMVEATTMLTEAKSATLQEMNVDSTLETGLATGTGTDAVSIVNGTGPLVEFTGKHTLFGELLGQMTLQVVKDSCHRALTSQQATAR